MPIVQTYPDDFGDNSKEEYLKRQLLEKIASAKYEVRTDFQFTTTFNRVKKFIYLSRKTLKSYFPFLKSDF